MKTCMYVVKKDRGLAPNPFYGYCTLGLCTPNHQGARLVSNDWIVGFLDKKRNHRLLYAMKIDEILDFDQYFKDKRFKEKKPKVRGNWKDKCGDNMYYRSKSGKWKWLYSVWHNTDDVIKKDLKYPRVYIGKEFYYLGEEAFNINERFGDVINLGRGIRYIRDGKRAKKLIEWIKLNIDAKGIPDPNDKYVNKKYIKCCNENG